MNNQSSLFQEVPIEVISSVFQNTMHENAIWEANLMDGGMFNTTYLIEYGEEHKKAILRLGPVNRHLLMGFEDNLMNAEVYTYSVCHRIGIPCSHVLVCDTSKQLIDRDFMIAAYIPSLAMSRLAVPKEKKNELYAQLGKYLAKLHQVTGDRFGYVSRVCRGMGFEKWSDALCCEVDDITGRLIRNKGLTQDEADTIRSLYHSNRKLLDEITVPHLLHTDLWEGNVLLDADSFEILAIIDSDRSMYGDPLFEFSSPWMGNPLMLDAYHSESGSRALPGDEKRRCLYRMYYHLVDTYVGSGEYNNKEHYESNKSALLQLSNSFMKNHIMP